MLPATTRRVPEHTSEKWNDRILRKTEESVARYTAAGRPAINRRLAELDREWDIERALEANAATAVLVGVGLAASRGRRWLLVPATVAGFLLMHALQGWCPPVPIFRRLGFRTASEIDYERYALKVLRGDFENLPASPDCDRAPVSRALHAVEH